jgi:enoyl-CoA hydratase/carnithine racemase
VRAVVLSGEGRAFCAGLDMGMFAEMDPARSGEARAEVRGDPLSQPPGRITHLGQQIAWVWQELPVPVIAAVHGVAFGGGIQIALGADIRIVAPDARLSVMELKWGLIPDMTGTYTLGRLVRPDVAKELAMTGRIIDGEEAVRLGLATRTSTEPLADALAFARTIAGVSPDSVRAVKRLVDGAPGRSPAEQFAAERAEVLPLLGSPNQREAVLANLEKRPPRFV